MKQLTKLFIVVFFILTAVKVADSQTSYSISGKARYSDTREIVTSGQVKLYRLDGTLDAVANIQTNGDWIIIPMIVGDMDLIGFPNVGNEFDFTPTSTEMKTNPAEFVHIRTDHSITGVELLVKRYNQGRPITNPVSVTGLVLNNNNQPVKDAVVYAMNGEEFIGHGVTNSKGEYKINGLPEGDFILVAHKIGSQSDTRNISLNEKGAENVTFRVIQNANFSAVTDPFDFTLSQNYPNPFNPSTVISYSLPKEGLVTLKVFNTAGQQVAELVNSVQNAGTYNVEFNANDLSSGVYYYRLDGSGLTETKKMILVK